MKIVEELERKMDISPRPGDDVTVRLRRLRSKIHQIRIDPDSVARHEVAATWADEAILALRILGYSSPYVAENPTLDRFSETTLKLLQDVNSRHFASMGDRKALIRIGDPIPLVERLAAESGRLRLAARDVTAELEAAVQDGIDRINEDNRELGSEMFVRS